MDGVPSSLASIAASFSSRRAARINGGVISRAIVWSANFGHPSGNGKHCNVPPVSLEFPPPP